MTFLSLSKTILRKFLPVDGPGWVSSSLWIILLGWTWDIINSLSVHCRTVLRSGWNTLLLGQNDVTNIWIRLQSPTSSTASPVGVLTSSEGASLSSLMRAQSPADSGLGERGEERFEYDEEDDSQPPLNSTLRYTDFSLSIPANLGSEVFNHWGRSLRAPYCRIKTLEYFN